MAKLKITTRERVSVREDAGTTYERIGFVPAWKTLEVEEAKTDVGGTTWYKISNGEREGWICSKFCDVGVTHAPKINPRDDDDVQYDDGPSTPTDNDPVSNMKASVMGSIGNLASSIGNGISEILDGFLGQSVTAQDYYLMKRRIMGAPYQFLGATDIRPNSGGFAGNMGRIYTNNILAEAPLISLMPCKPHYLPSLSQEEKDIMMQTLIEQVQNSTTDLLKAAAEDFTDGIITKYYGTDTAHTEYMKYVNLMCRAASLFMGIGQEMVPGTMCQYQYYDWTNWRLINTLDNSGLGGGIGEDLSMLDFSSPGALISSATGAINNMGDQIDAAKNEAWNSIPTDFSDFMSSFSTEEYFVDFYVTPSTNYTESFGNRTEESAFAGVMNKGSEMMKELLFVLGPDGLNNETVRASLAKSMEEGAKAIAQLNPHGSNLMSRLLMDAQTVVSGSNIIFPEIWHDSSFDKSYRAEIKLVAPYGTRECIFLNLLVPMFHALAFTLPRQTGVNSYGAPFLIKGHSNKWFNIEMGIVDSLEISKSGWTPEGFPTEMTISMGFKDLYSAISMSKFDDPKAGVYFALNQSFIEYLSVNCGLNMKVSEWETKLRMLSQMAVNMVADAIPNTMRQTHEDIGNVAGRILGGVV